MRRPVSVKSDFVPSLVLPELEAASAAILPYPISSFVVPRIHGEPQAALGKPGVVSGCAAFRSPSLGSHSGSWQGARRWSVFGWANDFSVSAIAWLRKLSRSVSAHGFSLWIYNSSDRKRAARCSSSRDRVALSAAVLVAAQSSSMRQT